MSLALDRPEFAPPPQRGTPRAVVLALIAHGLLIAALTWGVRWKSEADEGAVDAELWSSTVQQAAPRLQAPQAPTPVPTPPPPVPAPVPPTPAPTPAPPPPPPPPVAKAPEPAPAPKAPDIALEREKKLKEQKEQKERELEKQQQQKKKELEAKQRAEDEAEKKQAQLKEQQKEQQKKLADQKKQQEAEAKQAEAKKAADAKQAEAKKAEAATKQAAADRAATLKRMQGMAGASGADDSKGNALRSSGPSGGYGAKVNGAVRPNVVYPDAELVSGNPGAEFDVRLAPDGTIVGTPTLTKSSGLPTWDEAALRALQKTEKLPRDIDGTVPPRLIITLRPKR